MLENIRQNVKQGIKDLLPRGMRVSKPIVQMYLNSNGISSRYHLTNIPSLYSPKTAYPVFYDCSLYSDSGNLLDKKTIQLEPYCSFEVNPPEFFDSIMPPTGLFVARMRPSYFFQYADRHLGVLTAHFYAFYQDIHTGSMALVHPQTHLQAPGGNREWKSRVMIDRSKIQKVLILQINPTETAFDNEIRFYSSTDELLHQTSFHLEPMGCEKQEIDINLIKTSSPFLYIGANRLSTNNAKPIIFLYDKDHQFFGLHA